MATTMTSLTQEFADMKPGSAERTFAFFKKVWEHTKGKVPEDMAQNLYMHAGLQQEAYLDLVEAFLREKGDT
jgi:hypothetical protein